MWQRGAAEEVGITNDSGCSSFTHSDEGRADVQIEDRVGGGAKIVGLPIRGFDVYTEFIPNKHVTEKSSNPMVGTAYDFESEGSGTKLTMEHRPESFWGFPPLRT